MLDTKQRPEFDIKMGLDQSLRWFRGSFSAHKPVCLLDETWPRFDLELTFFFKPLSMENGCTRQTDSVGKVNEKSLSGHF